MFSIVASTLPIPSGIFIPVFKIGAGLGRLTGESIYLWFLYGARDHGRLSSLQPGGYAVVGAAAFSGAVTHTVSVSVIVFEMTGQISHVVPVMIAVLISNAVASLLQPSMYDSIIVIKKLPFLPDLLSSNCQMYKIFVEDFMVKDVKFVWQGIKYCELRYILKSNKFLKSFPLIDKRENMILLGSVPRTELSRLIKNHIGRARKLNATNIHYQKCEIR